MTLDSWAKETAPRLLVEHRKILRNWGSQKWHLEIWLRDACCCVYCGRDLLLDRGITYSFYCYDHILPKERYPALVNETWNKALSCLACNSWKSTFDPAADGLPANEEYRYELIESAKKYVSTQKMQSETLFAEEKAIIVAALRTYKPENAATAR